MPRQSDQQIFAKLKGLLRIAAARNLQDLWHTSRQALARFKAGECRTCLAAPATNTDLAVAP
ncbi:hypothetical protein [Methylobacterium tarhaniae]|nr:hypothetical protein [Methylobacterium tarhaniae]